jgi:hypothetical protein
MGLGSKIRNPEKTYSGSRIQGQKGSGSRIRIRNTALKKNFKCTVWHLYFSASFSDDPALFLVFIPYVMCYFDKRIA